MVGSPSGLPAAPAMFLHKATGQAVVKLSGRFVYLGAFGSEEAQQRYRRVVGEFQATGGIAAEQLLTVDHVIAGYWRHAEIYYRKNGKPTSELSVLRLAMRPLQSLYGSLPAAEFGPPSCLTGVLLTVEQGSVRCLRKLRRAMNKPIVCARILRHDGSPRRLRHGKKR